MEGTQLFMVIASSLGGLTGLAALITALSKRKVNDATILNLVEQTYKGIVDTLRNEMAEQKTYFEGKIERLKKIIENQDQYIIDVRCDRKGCENRMPPEPEKTAKKK